MDYTIGNALDLKKRHQPHVGIVKRIAHTSDGILLATRPGIVAFLDKKANISKYQIDIEWRLQFDDSVEAIYSDRNENLILNVLDDYSHQLYSVDRNGYRNWDIKIPSSSESSKTKPKILKNDRFVFALFSDKLAKIRNGTTIYTTTINGGTEVVFGDDSLVFVVQSVNDQLLQVQPIDNDGKMLDTLDFGIIDNPDTTTIISGMGPIRYLVFETKGGPQFTRLGSKKNEILSLANIIPDHVSLIPLQSHKSLFPNCFVSVSKTKTELVCIIEDGTAKVISSFENSNLLRPRFEFNVLDKNTFVVTMVGKDKDQVYHESIVMHDGLVTRKSGYIEFNFKKSGEIQWVPTSIKSR